jgi:hypothetical protein
MIAARHHGACTNTNMADFGLVAAVDGHFSRAILHHRFGTSSTFLARLEYKMNVAVQGFDLRKVSRSLRATLWYGRYDRTREFFLLTNK